MLGRHAMEGWDSVNVAIYLLGSVCRLIFGGAGSCVWRSTTVPMLIELNPGQGNYVACLSLRKTGGERERDLEESSVSCQAAWPPRQQNLEQIQAGLRTFCLLLANHAVNGNPVYPPFPEGLQMAMFGMGCFWGAERKFWQLPGVFSTQVGFSGGFTPNPTYKEVCTGMTGHVEVVRIVFDPQTISYEALLKIFWENHDPTQGMRQHQDVGTQYRSAIYSFGTEQLESALRSKAEYEQIYILEPLLGVFIINCTLFVFFQILPIARAFSSSCQSAD
ncbi:peptide methionine sulfoxide reductase MsrA-like isoform X2 [Paroedura picta]|uniref:peptide methionine sulfoxide reductase MsrA-like isoform X2 n=1 Tax=Paroedura picta TaxID=143630 RepID=UPI0040571EE7